MLESYIYIYIYIFIYLISSYIGNGDGSLWVDLLCLVIVSSWSYFKVDNFLLNFLKLITLGDTFLELFFLKSKIILLIQTYNRSIDLRYK